MKRLFSIALLLSFTFSTIGVIASSYSCPMMKASSKMCCNSGCCKQEVKLLKVKDDFVSASFQKAERFDSAPVTLMAPTFSKSNAEFSHVLFSEDDHAPPGKIIDRLSFIQSFLIWFFSEWEVCCVMHSILIIESQQSSVLRSTFHFTIKLL